MTNRRGLFAIIPMMNYTGYISVYLSNYQRVAERESERDTDGQRGVKRLTTAQFTNKGR